MRGATAPDMELGHGIKGVVTAGPRDGVEGVAFYNPSPQVFSHELLLVCI